MAVQMQFLLRGILAWELTERDGAIGLIYLVFGGTMLIATPLGGVAADRLPKRTVMLWSHGRPHRRRHRDWCGCCLWK